MRICTTLYNTFYSEDTLYRNLKRLKLWRHLNFAGILFTNQKYNCLFTVSNLKQLKNKLFFIQ